MDARTLETQANLQLKRCRVRVRGSVQGVGFRPFVFGLAKRLELSGWVKNDGEGVLLEIEGGQTPAFLQGLSSDAPPLSRIDSIAVEDIVPTGEIGFAIQASSDGLVSTMIGADARVCDACLEEMFDARDRRYLYPFLNCTHCGPRYTITRHLPYDRAQTSMAPFAMCEPCAAEYKDPLDRRFHAQPTACPKCGPHLSHSVAEIVQAIVDGRIVALKGIGGFHLVCDARNEHAVSRLRKRKGREAKPLAVMVLNTKSAERMAQIGEEEASLLQDKARPIVLCKAQLENGLAQNIAPGLTELGLVLPYAPLHFLLFHEILGCPDGLNWLSDAREPAFVLTSANPSHEPLVIGNDEAKRRLGDIADLIVDHDRDILIRNDDSVMRVIGGAPAFIRRARGYVPDPIELPQEQPVTLAVGGHLKNTICITRGKQAFVSQHIGDLDTGASFGFFREMVDHLTNLLDVHPERVGCDLHPDFLSTRYAEETGLPLVRVQHHHAHIASVAAEAQMMGPVLGLCLDGYGFGHDGEAWGGEVILHEGQSFQRLANLKPIALPGGDIAAREPWRIAAGVLSDLGFESDIARRFSAQAGAGMIPDLIARGIAPRTSSAGRLFDAAAALLGDTFENRFEAEAAMKLEALVTDPIRGSGLCRFKNGTLDPYPLLEVLSRIEDKTYGASLFHGALIDGLIEMIVHVSDEIGQNKVALTGGCFLNRVLSDGLMKSLRATGITPIYPRKLPPGDGGISLGQAFIAGHANLEESR